MPASFVKHIHMEVEGRKFKFINDWKYEDKYGRHLMARYFEYGTRQHWIAPRFKKVLTWLSAGPESGHGHAIYSKRYDNKKGQRLFSKGHYVSGLRRSEAMNIGFKKGIARFKEEWHGGSR